MPEPVISHRVPFTTGSSFCTLRLLGGAKLLINQVISPVTASYHLRTDDLCILIWVISGRVQVDVDGNRRDMIPGSVIVRPPGTTSERTVLEPSRWIGIGLPSCAAPLLEGAGVDLRPDAVSHHDPRDTHLMRRIVGVQRRVARGRPGTDLLPELLDLFITLRGSAVASSESAWLQAAERHLREDLAGQFELSALSKRMRLSESAFRHRFEALAGIPPHRWRILRRLDHVDAMLQEGCTPAEAARAMGYASTSSLSRQYRQVRGHTMTAARRQ